MAKGLSSSGVTAIGIWLSHGLLDRKERDWHKPTDQSRGVGQKPGTEEGAGIPTPGRGAASAAETVLCG